MTIRPKYPRYLVIAGVMLILALAMLVIALTLGRYYPDDNLRLFMGVYLVTALGCIVHAYGLRDWCSTRIARLLPGKRKR